MRRNSYCVRGRMSLSSWATSLVDRRMRVRIIVKEGVDIPSDCDGVVYIAPDARDGWKMGLIREWKAAGFEVNANRAIRA